MPRHHRCAFTSDVDCFYTLDVSWLRKVSRARLGGECSQLYMCKKTLSSQQNIHVLYVVNSSSYFWSYWTPRRSERITLLCGRRLVEPHTRINTTGWRILTLAAFRAHNARCKRVIPTQFIVQQKQYKNKLIALKLLVRMLYAAAMLLGIEWQSSMSLSNNLCEPVRK